MWMVHWQKLILVCIVIVVTGIALPVLADMDGSGSAGDPSVQFIPANEGMAPGQPADPLYREGSRLPVPTGDEQPGGGAVPYATFQWAVPSPANVQPESVAVDSSGNVYVTDLNNNSVWKFTADGTPVTKWGTLGSGPGQFNYPEGIAVSSTGYVYVADSNNNRVQEFTLAGAFVREWGSPGTDTGKFD